MLPLTPGCLALVLTGPQTGTIVTCIKHIGIPTLPNIIFEVQYDCWEVDHKLPWANTANLVTLLNVYPTQYLMKINGHKADAHDQVHKILEKST